MALFVPETCPRKSKRGFFVTFNANFYLRNRKLLLRRCKLPSGRLRWCKLLASKLPRGRLRLRRYNLLRGRLPWRMVLRNVAKDTPLGLDTGGWRLIEWRYNKGEREKGNPNGHRNRLLRRARRLLHRRPGGRPGRLRRLTRRPPLRRGPSHARRRPRNGSLGRLRGRGGATLPAKARQALRGAISKPEGPPRRRGRPEPGCAPPETAPSNYATSVLRKSRNLICDLRLTFRNRD